MITSKNQRFLEYGKSFIFPDIKASETEVSECSQNSMNSEVVRVL